MRYVLSRISSPPNDNRPRATLSNMQWGCQVHPRMTSLVMFGKKYGGEIVPPYSFPAYLPHREASECYPHGSDSSERGQTFRRQMLGLSPAKEWVIVFLPITIATWEKRLSLSILKALPPGDRFYLSEVDLFLGVLPGCCPYLYRVEERRSSWPP